VSAQPGCPDAEQLAAYADGLLDPAQRAGVERHLADCADCRAVLAEAVAFVQGESGGGASAAAARVVPFRRRRVVTGVGAILAAAAALVLVVRLAQPAWVSGLFGPRSDRPELAELVAAVAEEPTRPVEGRLTGGFEYAPPPSPTRGPGDREVSPDVRIAAAKIEKRAQAEDTPENEAALGVAYLTLREWDEAVDALRRAAERRPETATYQNDLAAAYLARAASRGGGDDARQALAAAERALALRADMPEAMFNRALALEMLGRHDEARRAWDALAGRRDRGWAAEATRHLRQQG
jgi:tetratricopeptide (TPR) repeat protein